MSAPRTRRPGRTQLLWAGLAGLMCGFALASKVSVWMLVPLIVLCVLVALVLDRGGLDPTVVVGGRRVLLLRTERGVHYIRWMLGSVPPPTYVKGAGFKEGVRVERENVTYATITIQNYFRMYQKLAGMTGTALTEAEEFDKIHAATHKRLADFLAAPLKPSEVDQLVGLLGVSGQHVGQVGVAVKPVAKQVHGKAIAQSPHAHQHTSVGQRLERRQAGTVVGVGLVALHRQEADGARGVADRGEQERGRPAAGGEPPAPAPAAPARPAPATPAGATATRTS